MPGGIGDAIGRITTDTSPEEPFIRPASPRCIGAARPPRPRRRRLALGSADTSGAVTRIPSRDPSQATWYSGLTRLVDPGAPVSSCVA